MAAVAPSRVMNSTTAAALPEWTWMDGPDVSRLQFLSLIAPDLGGQHDLLMFLEHVSAPVWIRRAATSEFRPFGRISPASSTPVDSG